MDLEEPAEQTEDRGLARPAWIATWLGGLAILAWLALAYFLNDLVRLMFGDIDFLVAVGGYGMPLVALAFNAMASLAVRGNWVRTHEILLGRAIFSMLAFAWLAWAGLWLFMGLVIVPAIGVPALGVFGLELGAEVLWIVAWLRSRKMRRDRAWPEDR